MNSKILVGIAVSSLVLASGALAEGTKAAKKEHSKGSHKGHVSHKSVGGEGRCDDLRKQLDDLNASYQERIGALEQEVADLQEDQHNHDTLLLDPEKGSWQLGFDLWRADADGGDIGFGTLVSNTGGAGAGGAGNPFLLGQQFRSFAGDDTAWSASIGWQAKDDTNYRFKYTRFDSDAAYNVGGFTGPTGAGNQNFVSNPFTAFAANNGLLAAGAAVNGFQNAFGSRNVDVKDFEFQRDTRMFASKKFAVNWQWGIRNARVEDAQTFIYTNANVPAGVAGAAAPANTRQTAIRTSQFRGWGPGAGISGRYYLSDSFELQGGVGGAALLGDTNSGTTLFIANPTNVAGGGANRAVIATGARSQDVKPVLDLSSKLVWHAGNHLDVWGGWQSTRYFNAIDSDFGLDKQQKDLNLSGVRAGVLWNFD